MKKNNNYDSPFFSILIPVYNQELYLSYCIESVINQSFKNFEIILVDDGSTDKSVEICDQYALLYPQKICVIHKKNEGLLFARKSGIEKAKGNYFLFLDSDDCIRKNTLEVIFEVISKTLAQMVIFNASYQEDFYTKINEYPFDNKIFLEDENKVLFLDSFCGTHMFNNMCFKCVNRELIDLKDYNDGDGVWYGEDLFQSIPLIDRANSIYIIDVPLYFYRQHEKSMTHFFSYSQFESIKKVCNRFLEYGEKWECNYNIMLMEKINMYISNECYRTAKNILKSDDIFDKKCTYLIKLKKDKFYDSHINNINMHKNLKLYEKIILFFINLNSKKILYLLSNVFSVIKGNRKN